MRWTPWRRAGLAGLCLIAGCAPKSGGGAAANVATPPADAVITAAQFPQPKLGYWEHTELDNGGAPKTTYDCETNNALDPAELAAHCASLVIKHTAQGDYTIDLTCPGDSGAMKTAHFVMKGDPNVSYSLDAKIVTTTPGQPTMTDVRHQDSHFAGPCPTTE